MTGFGEAMGPSSRNCLRCGASVEDLQLHSQFHAHFDDVLEALSEMATATGRLANHAIESITRGHR